MHTSRAKLVLGWSLFGLGLCVLCGLLYLFMVAVPARHTRETAAALQTQAQELLAASQQFRTARLDWPTTFREIIDGHFMKSVPVPPQEEGVSGQWKIVSPGVPYIWLHNGVSKKVCRDFNVLVRGDDGIQVAARQSLKLQCFGSTEPYTIAVGVGAVPGVLNMSAVLPAADPKISVDDFGSTWASRPTIASATNMRSPVLTDTVNFGIISVGARSPQNILITNHSKQPMHVSGVYGLPESVELQRGGAGICPGRAFDLAPEGSCSLSLVFTAKNDIPLEGTLTITTDYDGYRDIALTMSGQGIDQIGTVRTMNSGCVSPDPFGYDAGRRMMITYGMYAADLYGHNGWVTVAQGCPNDGEFAPYTELSAPFAHGPVEYMGNSQFPRLDCPAGYDPTSLMTKNAAYDASSDTLVYTALCRRLDAAANSTTPGLLQIKRGTDKAYLVMSPFTAEGEHNWTPMSANDNSAVYYVAANADNTGLELRRLEPGGHYRVVFAQFFPSFLKDVGVVDPREGNRYVWFPMEEGHQMAKVDTSTGTFTVEPMANTNFGTMYEMMTNTATAAMDMDGLLYTSGKTRTTITVTDVSSGKTSIFAGALGEVSMTEDGDAKSARFQHINGIRITKDEKYLMVADQSGEKYTMRKVRIRN